MPFKFKDDGSHIVKPLQRKLYFIIGCLIIARPLITIYLFHNADGLDIMNIVLGIFLIWGVNFNGFYKLARKYMEWKIRRSNKFDYYSR